MADTILYDSAMRLFAAKVTPAVRDDLLDPFVTFRREVDRVFAVEGSSRDAVLDIAKAEASERAVAAGADRSSVKIVEVEDVPLAYLPGNATRIRVKAVGDLLMN